MTGKRLEIRAEAPSIGSRLCVIILSALCVFGAQQARAQAQDAAASAAVSAHAPERCTEVAVDVAAASPDQRRLVCSAASRAVERLGRCEILLQRPLRIEIRDEVRHPLHGRLIFGFFETAQEVVLITKYDNIPALAKDTPYGQMRPLDFYKSLVVHEVVHGVMHQNLVEYPTSSAAYEYPAYALQIESLPSDQKSILLRATASEPGIDGFIFSDIVLFFDPFLFAARAYQYFKASPDRCGQLLALLEGQAPFIRASPLF